MWPEEEQLTQDLEKVAIRWTNGTLEISASLLRLIHLCFGNSLWSLAGRVTITTHKGLSSYLITVESR